MITINNNNYELIKDEKGGYEEEIVKERLTDYFDEFDYVVGDWAYGKLRLKGFNDKGHKNFKKIRLRHDSNNSMDERKVHRIQ